jgi:hypothetical protein
MALFGSSAVFTRSQQLGLLILLVFLALLAFARNAALRL